MKLKRILVFALALMVMAMPIGFAEAGYGALTLSNIHLDVPGMTEPLDIDAALKIGVGGQDDGTGRVDVDLTGGGQPAFSGSASFDQEKVQAVIGGSTYYMIADDTGIPYRNIILCSTHTHSAPETAEVHGWSIRNDDYYTQIMEPQAFG
jgi:hypothetical protein